MVYKHFRVLWELLSRLAWRSFWNHLMLSTASGDSLWSDRTYWRMIGAPSEANCFCPSDWTCTMILLKPLWSPHWWFLCLCSWSRGFSLSGESDVGGGRDVVWHLQGVAEIVYYICLKKPVRKITLTPFITNFVPGAALYTSKANPSMSRGLMGCHFVIVNIRLNMKWRIKAWPQIN